MGSSLTLGVLCYEQCTIKYVLHYVVGETQSKVVVGPYFLYSQTSICSRDTNIVFSKTKQTFMSDLKLNDTKYGLTKNISTMINHRYHKITDIGFTTCTCNIPIITYKEFQSLCEFIKMTVFEDATYLGPKNTLVPWYFTYSKSPRSRFLKSVKI